MISYRLLSILFTYSVCISFSSCVDTSTKAGFGWSDDDYEVAIPITNTKISVAKIANSSSSNTALLVGTDGKVSVVYRNDNVLTKNAAAIFPPFPGLFPYLLTDTISIVPIPIFNTQNIRKAIFKDTKINFYFESSLRSDVKIVLRIDELSKNNIKFSKEFNLKYTNILPVSIQSEPISVDGYTFQSETNTMTFRYEAILPDGKKIVLDKAWMGYDIIKFAYIEGYLGYQVFPLEGSIIDVGLFNQWQSGTLNFEDPKISIILDNAFGIPVRSQINKFELTSITGQTTTLQSPFLVSGIDFDFPKINEVGAIKTTRFEFNKNNSNIRDIFNEKIKTITYDINALVNPNQDQNSNGFVTENSYFIAKVAVEVPLFGSLSELVISDTIDVQLKELENVSEIEFKTITANDFPADLTIQAYFLDDNNRRLEQLFDSNGLTMAAANLLPDGTTSSGAEKTTITTFDNNKCKTIKTANKMVIVGTINTTNSNVKRPLWIYDNYGITFKCGAKLKYKL